jgi:hypothetical protein
MAIVANKSDAEIDSGNAAEYSSKSFPVTTGENILEWWLQSDPNIITAGGNRFRRLSVKISESGQSDTVADRSTMDPPKITGLYIQYRPERRIP